LKSVEAVALSSAWQLNPQVLARGVFLGSYYIRGASEGEPSRLTASARIYSPNGTGHFVDLDYENGKRVRTIYCNRWSKISGFSHIYVRMGGPGFPSFSELKGTKHIVGSVVIQKGDGPKRTELFCVADPPKTRFGIEPNTAECWCSLVWREACNEQPKGFWPLGPSCWSWQIWGEERVAHCSCPPSLQMR
jgi:hypothetical protein